MKYQKGIGLIEVMVALLLLAVAVLGFSSMQMFAIKSSDESVMRTRAISVIRGGSELMRANASAIDSFKQSLNTTPAVSGITKDSCVLTAAEEKTVCSVEALATKDALMLKEYAAQNDLSISLQTCPGMTGSMARQCFIASWGGTLATMSDDANACANAQGVYKMGANCFIMEAY